MCRSNMGGGGELNSARLFCGMSSDAKSGDAPDMPRLCVADSTYRCYERAFLRVAAWWFERAGVPHNDLIPASCVELLATFLVSNVCFEAVTVSTRLFVSNSFVRRVTPTGSSTGQSCIASTTHEVRFKQLRLPAPFLWYPRALRTHFATTL